MSDNKEYLEMFFAESEEYIQTLNGKILDLEENPENKNNLQELFRAAHSLKGMAATMGFEVLSELTHKMENLLDQMREDKLQVTTELIDLLFAGIDHIEDIVKNIKEDGTEDIELDDYLGKIEKYLKESDNIEDTQKTETDTENIFLELPSEKISTIKDNKKETDRVNSLIVHLEENTNFPQARAAMILNSAEDFGVIVNSRPEKENIEEAEISEKIIYLNLISNLSQDEIQKEFKKINDVKEVQIKEINLDNIEEQTSKKSKKDQTSKTSTSSNFEVSSSVRVDINKLDNLMNMIGELLINKTRLQSLDIQNDDFKDVLPQLDRVTMELHHTVMQIRMEPIGVMFNRFPRMIRDISKKENKEVNFIMEGEDTELDRSIIDELGDPLTHLLRNAVDHGIEKPEKRVKKGKEKEGTLALRAYQKGSEIMIEVEDDGAGIDTDTVVEKAIDKEVINSQEIEEMDQNEKLNLIFHPGLSTAEEVSDVSGRGVGMDVVKKTIEDLDGEIYIESTPDEGSKFSISLPLTLAITEALMIKIDEGTFAIPLNNIRETLMIAQKEIKHVKGKEVISLREETIPLIDSRKNLNLDTDYGVYRDKEEFPAVLIQSGNNQFGLIVDELLQQQEIVIKSLGEYLGNVQNISGATIIGDGEVALILDVRNIA